MPHKPGIGAILGVVSEDGVAKEDFPVTLLDRTTGALVARHTTDSNGAFTFNGLNPDTDDYMVIAQDEDKTDTDSYKDAIVRDRIQPIAASQGSLYYENWRKLAYERGAIGLYAPREKSTNSPTLIRNSAGSNGRTIAMASGTTTLSEVGFKSAITPGALSIPATVLTTQKLHVPAESSATNAICASKNSAALWTSTTAASFEAVVDLSTVSITGATTGIVYFTSLVAGVAQTSSSSTAASPLCGFYYDVSAKTVTLINNNGGVNNLGATSGNYNTCGSFSVTGYLDGPHHFLVSIGWSSTANLYIDGQLVMTTSISGATAYAYGYASADYFYGDLGVYTNSQYHWDNIGGANASVGPMACYPQALTATDALALYNALMVGTTPELTGYAKDVELDCPITYVRMQEVSGSVCAEYLKKDYLGIWEGAIYGSPSFNQTSPVTGGVLMGFSGSQGIRFDYLSPYLPAPDGFAIEWVGAAPASTPTANNVLAMVSDANESQIFFQLYESTAGKLCVICYLQSGSTETVTFSGTTLDSLTHHYAVCVDKVNLVATLYIDGAAVETQTLTSVLTLYTEYSRSTERHLHLAGVVSDAGVVTYGASWAMGELAIYAFPISATRIASHYAAMETI